jgi:NAD(P) transhydrogenase
MKTKEYDLLVLGSGPAGIHGAVQAAKLGKKVAIIEKNEKALGGAWIHTGTLPSKTIREVVATVQSIKPHVGKEWVDRLVQDLSTDDLKNRAHDVATSEESLVQKHLANNNIEVIRGFGRIEDPFTVRVVRQDGDPIVVRSAFILIGTGSKPRRPDEIPFDDWRIVDSDSILQLEHLPRSLQIYGAGVIGCEYACIFGALGVKTTIIDSRTRIMQTVDQEVAGALKTSMEEMGIEFQLGYTLKKLTTQGPKVIAQYDKGSLESDVFFFAAGRQSNSAHIGLERVDIKTDARGTICVDQFFRTNVPNIYAAGDVIGPPALASTSAEQGRIAVRHAFGDKQCKFPEVYPVGIYTIPEISSVGKTEEMLIQEKAEYVVGRASFDEVARGHIRGESHGLLKILVDVKTKQIVGIHVIGADAANLIHIGLCCMLAGLPLDELVNSVLFNYPTLAEAYRVAAFNALNKIYPNGQSVKQAS